MKTSIEEASEIKKQLMKLFAEADTCFAHTDEQWKYCDKNCEGHGCPVWEETASKVEKITEAYYKAKFLEERESSLKDLRERFFGFCTAKGDRPLITPSEIFEWFKPYLASDEEMIGFAKKMKSLKNI